MAMKNIIPTLIKLGLVVLFIQNIGGWDFVQKAHQSSNENSPTPQQLSQIERLTLEKIRSAEEIVAQGRIYSPDDYFQDLLAIDSYARSLGLKNSWFNMNVIMLQNVVQKQVANQKITNHQITAAVQRYKGQLDNQRTNNHSFAPVDWSTVFFSAAGYLWLQYQSNLFFGLALFLVWFYQGKQSLMIRSPFSFILAVAVYPVIIGISWYQGLRGFGRGVYGEAVARKFKYRIFDLLAENEVEVIKQFVAGRITRHHLDSRFSQGRTAQRSVIVALLATMILLIVPKESLSSCHDQLAKALTETVNKASPEAKVHLDQDDRGSQGEPAGVFFPEPCFDSFLMIRELVGKTIMMSSKIDHIPVGGLLFIF